MSFDAGIQKLKCPYCDTEFDVEALQHYDADLSQNVSDEMDWNTASDQWSDEDSAGMNVYICNSCGGEIIGDSTMAATSCPYCGNPVVIKGKLSGDLKPDYVIPFKLDKQAAIEALKKHMSGRKLLPKVFSSQNHLEEVKGVYVPYWLFDGEAHAKMLFRGTNVRMWADRDFNYTETSYYSISRAGTLSFEHIPADGSTKMDDTMMESLEPFDFSEAVDFQTAYLAGYLADRYDVTADQTLARVNERAKTSTESLFNSTVGPYATIEPMQSAVQLQKSKVSYALYPVWLLQTKWNGQNYLFAMNGQTGKFVGDLPTDNGLLWKYRAIITGITAAVVTALMFFMNNFF